MSDSKTAPIPLAHAGNEPSASDAQALVRKMEGRSIEEILRLQAELQQMVRQRYEKQVAVLFSDIVGSTRYFEKNGDAAGRLMIQRHNDLLIPVVKAHSGRVVKLIGDAIMATFADPQQAVEAGAEMLQLVAEQAARTSGGGERLQIRVGVNYGPALVNDSDGDLYGDMVNVAARVQAQADPDQLLVSEMVREHLSPKFPLRAVGKVAVKGKAQELVLHEVLWHELARRENTDESGVERPELDKRYAVLGLLGTGGMASVWRARDERLGREVAVKVLHRHLPFSLKVRERMQREARLAGALAHENIVQVYDFSMEGQGDAFIAMELVDGQSLGKFLERKQKLPPLVVLAIAHEVARGLACAHGMGVVHRDIKPDNVLLSSRGAVKLADFGIAAQEEMSRITATGGPIGTPAYLSPEQIRGEAADTRSDIFAVGVMLYELVTGAMPYDGKNATAVMYAIVQGRYVPPEQRVALPPGLADLIKLCLQVDPVHRFKDGSELEAACRRLLRAQQVVDPRTALSRYVLEGIEPGEGASISAANSQADLAAALIRASGEKAAPAAPVPTVASPAVRARTAPLVVGGIALGLLVGSGVWFLRHAGSAAPVVSAGPVASGGPVASAGTVASGPAVGSAPSSAAAGPASPVAPPVVSGPPGPSVPPTEAAAPKTEHPAVVPALGTRESQVRSAAAHVRSPKSSGHKAEPILAPTTPATLKLVTVNGWADIRVDGQPMGRTPAVRQLQLAPGHHVLELVNPLRKPIRTELDLSSGQVRELREELQPSE